MKTRLVLSISVLLAFFIMSTYSFAQEKPVTPVKTVKQIHDKQITRSAKTNKVSTNKVSALKTADKKITKKTGKMKNNKIVKNEASPKSVQKEVVHHKKLEKKTQKK